MHHLGVDIRVTSLRDIEKQKAQVWAQGLVSVSRLFISCSSRFPYGMIFSCLSPSVVGGRPWNECSSHIAVIGIHYPSNIYLPCSITTPFQAMQSNTLHLS